MFLLILALALHPAAVQTVSAECGPGYSKPRFGRCEPDRGHSLLRGCSPKLKPMQMLLCLRRHGGGL